MDLAIFIENTSCDDGYIFIKPLFIKIKKIIRFASPKEEKRGNFFKSLLSNLIIYDKI